MSSTNTHPAKNLFVLLNKPVLPFIIIVICVTVSFINAQKLLPLFPTNDLGPRIAGAVAITEKKSAYFYNQPGVPADSLTILNGCTITPFAILLHYPLKFLTSCSVREVWLVIEYLLLLACCIIAVMLTPQATGKYLLCICFALFFLFSKYWLMHLVLGQIHILYAFLFFVLYGLKVKDKNFLFGLVLAFTIACRPLFAPAVIMLFLWYNKKSLYGLAAGCVFLVLFNVFSGSTRYWMEYARAVKMYSLQIPADAHPEIAFKKPVTYLEPCTALQNTTTGDAKKINGLFNGLSRPAGLIKTIEDYLVANNIIITNTVYYSAVMLALAVLLILLAKNRIKTMPANKFLCLLFLIYITSEICTPAPRGPYNFMLWMFGAFLIISGKDYRGIILLFIGLALNYDHPYIHHGREWGEALMLLAGFLLLFSNGLSISGKKHAIT
ncbi:MAG TPA: glycosyltransferase family 87 protein [Chitinophagaceae bacterium]|nr:glycosyltransferase family 87 protein [Chitinophagaceae bacterium]